MFWLLAPFIGTIILALAMGIGIGVLMKQDRFALWTAGVLATIAAVLVAAGPLWIWS